MRAGLVLLAGLVVAVAVAPGAAGVVWCDGQVATIVGTAGPDSLYGTDEADVIAGLGGNDTIWGYGGADRICGGDGDDYIDGGDGTDRIRGNTGDDVLWGGPHFDTIWGGSGHDEVWPGEGMKSVVYAGAGRDHIVLTLLVLGDDYLLDGGPGRDLLDLRGVPPSSTFYWTVEVQLSDPAVGFLFVVESVSPIWGVTLREAGSVTSIEQVFGSAGNDVLRGDGRPNRLQGMAGNDELHGWGGRDRLLGGFGDDSLYGGTGDDRLVGGPGTDTLNGQAGSDICKTGELLFGCEA